MVPATRLTPKVMGIRTSPNSAAKMNVSGSSRHRRFLTATARYDGARNTMQQGANSATPPAKNAARTDPVVSRSPIDLTDPRSFQPPLVLAPGQPPGAEVLPVQQDQGTHRVPVPGHQRTTIHAADRQYLDGHRVPVSESFQGRNSVGTKMAGGCRHARDSDRYTGPSGL